MGGLVNVVTGSDYDHPLKLGIEGGSFSTFIGKISLSQRFGKHGLFFSSNSIESDGHIPETNFKSENYQLGYDYFANPVWQLSVKGSYNPYSFDDPSRQGQNPGFGTYGIIKRGNGSIILSNNDAAWKGSFQLYGNMGYHRFYDGFYSHDFTFGGSVYQQYKNSDQFSIALGSDYLYYGGLADYDNILHKLNSLGVYALALYSPLQNLSLRGGLRFQNVSLSIVNISPVFGITYNLLPNLELYANYQNGFRFPTIQELYLFPTSNPDLKDERVNGYEAGVKYYLSNSTYINFAAYYNKADNLIIIAAPFLNHFTNSGSTKIWGTETEAHIFITENLNTTLGYGYLDPGSLTAFNPKIQFKYMLTFQKDFYQVSLFGKYIRGLSALDNFSEVSRGSITPFFSEYNLLNLYSGFHFGNFILSVKINNLLNKNYYYLPGFKAPGISIITGIEYSL
jgi:iron complex outermembrane receptor protein